MGFSRQEYWSGLPCPPPGDLPNPGIELESLISPALAGEFFTANTWEALRGYRGHWTSPRSITGLQLPVGAPESGGHSLGFSRRTKLGQGWGGRPEQGDIRTVGTKQPGLLQNYFLKSLLPASQGGPSRALGATPALPLTHASWWEPHSGGRESSL